MMTYLMNTWYPAGFAHELEGGAVTRTLLETPVMIFRASDGELVALHDRCPHRFAPLSYGRIEDDKVVCTYHGLEFDRTGDCVGTQLCFGGAPKVAKVRTFPVVEQDGIIWIWMGEAAADLTRIPRLSYHADPKYRTIFGYTYVKCDFMLLNDNLMDLSHIVLLHPIFNAAHRQQTFKSWEEGDDVLAAYHAVEEDEEYHTINTIRWTAPSVTNLEMNVIPDYGRGDKVVEWSANIMTPETATTCHYFWSVAVGLDSPETDKQVMDRMIQVIHKEDVWMLEGVQSRMGHADLWDLDPVLIKTDAASVRMRRKLAKLIRAEAEARMGQPQRAADTRVAVLDRAVEVITT